MTMWRVCQPWWLRDLDEFKEHPRGANCEPCGRDIAVEREWKGRLICVYCAIDRAWIEDAPIGENARLVHIEYLGAIDDRHTR